jgi:hypothetical protein
MTPPHKLKSVLLMALAIGTFALASNGARIARGQGNATSSICVVVYNDANQNGSRDAGEVGLPNANLSLRSPANVLIANHITDSSTPYCFNTVAAGQYSLSVSSALYRFTTPDPIVFVAVANQPRLYEFGAVALPTQNTEPVPATGLVLNLPLRLGLSALGAVAAMIVFVGLGLVFYGLFLRPSRRVKRSATAERDAWQTPPNWDQRGGKPAERIGGISKPRSEYETLEVRPTPAKRLRAAESASATITFQKTQIQDVRGDSQPTALTDAHSEYDDQ